MVVRRRFCWTSEAQKAFHTTKRPGQTPRPFCVGILDLLCVRSADRSLRASRENAEIERRGHEYGILDLNIRKIRRTVDRQV